MDVYFSYEDFARLLRIVNEEPQHITYSINDVEHTAQTPAQVLQKMRAYAHKKHTHVHCPDTLASVFETCVYIAESSGISFSMHVKIPSLEDTLSYEIRFMD